MSGRFGAAEKWRKPVSEARPLKIGCIDKA
jgi:hypothetical protein